MPVLSAVVAILNDLQACIDLLITVVDDVEGGAWDPGVVKFVPGMVVNWDLRHGHNGCKELIYLNDTGPADARNRLYVYLWTGQCSYIYSAANKPHLWK